MEQTVTQNDDFKYILQDSSHIYFGKELSYQEMMDRKDVPLKWKAIISTYVSKDVPIEKKMVEHLLTMEQSSFTFQIYSQLKMQIRIFYKEEKKSLLGKTKEHWVHKSCTFVSFIEQYREQVINQQVMVEDISMSKIALMMMSL